MARRSGNDSLSIAELERLLSSRQKQLKRLHRKRDALQRRIDAIDDQIGSLGGPHRPGGRAHNAMSLAKTLEKVLSSGKPVKVANIVAAVKAAGYRSNSANFRAVVNQTLIKNEQFASAGRGMYQLKK